MNWLFWVVVVIMAYHVITGFFRGFLKKSVSALSIILTLVLVTWLTPQITSFIREYTSIHTSLQETCSEIFQNEEYDENVKTDQVLMIESLMLPENIKEMLEENNNREVYELLNVNDFSDYIGACIADIIISAMAYLLTFIIVWTVLRAIMLALDLVAKLPVLRGVNRLAGGLLGFAEAVIIIWVGFLLAAVLCSAELGQQFLALIEENALLSVLYETNVIMKIVLGRIF